MSRTRNRPARIVVLWTVFMLGVAIVLAAQAVLSLNSAEQACFMNYPTTPCPGRDDPAMTELSVAFFVVPLGWLIGLGVAGLVWSRRRRASSRH